MEAPTFSPSLLLQTVRMTEKGKADCEQWCKDGHPKLPDGFTFDNKPIICHSFITDGQIQYLSDCTHSLAGKTVPMEAF